MKYFVISVVVCFISSIGISQTYSWSGLFNSTQANYKQVLKSKTDSNNNVYIVGLFTGSVDFNIGVGTDIISSNGGQDVFLTKLDENGNYIWTKTFGGVKNEYLSDLEITSTSLLVVGEFWDSINFDPNGGSDIKSSNGATDIYIWNVAFDGSYINTKIIGGAGTDDIGSIHYSAAGDIYITGRFFETVNFNVNGGTLNLTPNSRFEQYIVKYNSNMDVLWAKNINNTPDKETLCIKTDATGNIGIIGEYFGSVDFNPGPGNNSLTAINPESNQMFYLRLDQNGNYLNAGSYQLRLRGCDFEYDASGIAHVIGNYLGEASINGNTNIADTSGGVYFRIGNNTLPIATPIYYEANGSIDAVRGISKNAGGFVILVNSISGTGNALDGMSLISFGTTQNFLGSVNIPNIYGSWLNIDSSNGIIVTGGLKTVADVDPSAGIATLTPFLGNSGFIVKYQ